MFVAKGVPGIMLKSVAIMAKDGSFISRGMDMGLGKEFDISVGSTDMLGCIGEP